MKQRILSVLESICEKKSEVSVALIGYGVTNRSILDIIREADGARITVLHNTPIELACGIEHKSFNNTDYLDYDIIFPSPSIRREQLKTRDNTVILSDTDLFFNNRPDNCYLISGSDGKSTTTTLVAELLREEYPSLFVGGNLGTPIADCDLAKADAFVIEMSSFNLRYVAPASRRAVITNITPNHLNWHASFEEYVSTKKNLLLRCSEPIINVDTAPCDVIARSASLFAACSSRLSHTELTARYRAEHTVTVENGINLDGKKILDPADIYLKERHNLENLASAIAVTLGLADITKIVDVARSFSGLEHRCEHFLTTNGIAFINSSIDTSPERTSATLRGLNRRVKILLGGRGKGLSLEPLRSALIKYANQISIYGDIGEELLEFIVGDPLLRNIPYSIHTEFSDAIESILSDLRDGDTVILSPAATSYGEFSDFSQRGARFKEIIRQKYKKI